MKTEAKQAPYIRSLTLPYAPLGLRLGSCPWLGGGGRGAYTHKYHKNLKKTEIF